MCNINTLLICIKNISLGNITSVNITLNYINISNKSNLFLRKVCNYSIFPLNLRKKYLNKYKI